MNYVVVAVAVFGVNLLPAFGPPTWSILVFFRLHNHLNAAALVVSGAVAAALGRYMVALGCRRLRGCLSPKRTVNLAAARDVLTKSRARSALGVGLFALSPVPSAQLFEAAGLMDLPLAPLTATFFAGRLVSYSLYVSGATALKNASFGKVITSSFTRPWGIALELLLLGALAALARVNWAALLATRSRDRGVEHS